MKSSDLIPYARILQVANGTDLNSVLVPGTYYLYGSVTNNPSGDALGANSILEVQAGRGTSLVQRVLSAATGNMYYRWVYNIKVSPVWSAWRKLTDSTSSLVNSFNARTGAVTLTSGDVTTALGYTPTSLTQVQQNAVGLYAAGSNVNLNNIMTAGIYKLDTTPINGPTWATSEYSQLLVFRGAGDTVVQMIVDWTTGYFSYRLGNPPPIGSGNWKPWQYVVTSANQTMQLANPWYIKIPGGLILQGGKVGPVGSAGGQGPYSFGTTFPNACISLVVSGEASNQVQVTGGSITTSNFKFDVNTGSNVYVHWTAAGY